MATVGFIGLGKVGLPAAANLIAAGHRVVGYRRSAMDAFVTAGGVAAHSPAEVAAAADIVLTCLPTEDALDEVIEGPAGLLGAARAGQVIAELGSHALARKARHVAPLAEKGAAFIDGEISGTPGMIAARRGAVYLAGDEEACRRLEPVMRGITETVYYFGPFGAACKVKLINNLLVMIHIAGTAEAMALALQAGLDPDRLIKAVMSGSGASTQFGIRAPWMAARRFEPAEGDPVGLLHYHGLISEMAGELGLETPLADTAAVLFRRAIEAGIGHLDNAAMVDIAGRPAPGPTKA
jgi:3-hydroxyisobutyrate dehydrogenase